MYSLLVSQQVEDRADGTFEVSKDRFLEFTSEATAAQLRPLSVESIDCIKSWPCVYMQEGRGEERAYVGRITAVHDAGGDIKLTIVSLPMEPPILNDDLWRIRTELDVEQFEFSRNHWAIKDKDLFHILRDAGHEFNPSVVALFEGKSLPAPSRPDLIRARNVISEWSHTKIDDFLLEAGVDGLVAARAIGGRRDRANAIVEFALAHPSATTAENSLLSVFIVRAAGPTTQYDSDAKSQLSVAPEGEAQTPQRRAEAGTPSRSPNRVFVVHGQNDTARSAVLLFLSKVGLIGIVLHEQPNMGRHLLTKFIEEAELVTFAIVLMTDDDMGSLKGHKLAPRARQNVILELGYFISHLGQERVCALITPGLETPSDFDGIVYIRMDADARWETELRRELLAAGMPLIEKWKRHIDSTPG
ncbi:MAG: nucleotide-binding protein [Nitrospirae bacterium]|nr:nucleotide-binding protein [Nitrospirota bacterium]